MSLSRVSSPRNARSYYQGSDDDGGIAHDRRKALEHQGDREPVLLAYPRQRTFCCGRRVLRGVRDDSRGRPRA